MTIFVLCLEMGYVLYNPFILFLLLLGFLLFFVNVIFFIVIIIIIIIIIIFTKQWLSVVCQNLLTDDFDGCSRPSLLVVDPLGHFCPLTKR